MSMTGIVYLKRVLLPAARPILLVVGSNFSVLLCDPVFALHYSSTYDLLLLFLSFLLKPRARHAPWKPFFVLFILRVLHTP